MPDIHVVPLDPRPSDAIDPVHLSKLANPLPPLFRLYLYYNRNQPDEPGLPELEVEPFWMELIADSAPCDIPALAQGPLGAP